MTGESVPPLPRISAPHIDVWRTVEAAWIWSGAGIVAINAAKCLPVASWRCRRTMILFFVYVIAWRDYVIAWRDERCLKRNPTLLGLVGLATTLSPGGVECVDQL